MNILSVSQILDVEDVDLGRQVIAQVFQFRFDIERHDIRSKMLTRLFAAVADAVLGHDTLSFRSQRDLTRRLVLPAPGLKIHVGVSRPLHESRKTLS